MCTLTSVTGHYQSTAIVERLLATIDRTSEEPLSMEELGQADEFHMRGNVATHELIQLAHITAEDLVVDLGSGLGGPARKIAFATGCHVTGVDLTPEFVDAATKLSALTGMSQQTEFRVANACDLPFADASFDVAWTQHTSMNIPDKLEFYSEIRRILRRGGRLAFYDVLAGFGEPVYPVPWAGDPSISHLASAAETREYLARTGFEVLAWNDLTQLCLDWLTQALPMFSANPNLPLSVIIGSDALEKFTNLLTNLSEGRVTVAMAVVQAK